MSNRYAVYRLRLPSGGVVRVRLPSLLVFLVHDVYALPLLHAAVDVSAALDTAPPVSSNMLDNMKRLARSVLVDDDCLDLMPLYDLRTLAHWALRPNTAEAWREEDEISWQADDLSRLVRGSGGILLDAVGKRYSKTPAFLVGLDELSDLGREFTLAIGYRGARMEHDGDQGDVEVEDAFGGKHRVPRSVLAHTEAPKGANVIRPEHYVRQGGEVHIGVGGTGSLTALR